MSLTQLEQVRNKLKKDGFVTRDWCLNRRITLGALIVKLKNEGWEFKAGYEKYEFGQDYVYYGKQKSKPITFNKEKKLETLQKPLFKLRKIHEI